MDYIYTFKQAHKDRLEDAGVISWRTPDGIAEVKPRHSIIGRAGRQVKAVVIAVMQLVTR